MHNPVRWVDSREPEQRNGRNVGPSFQKHLDSDMSFVNLEKLHTCPEHPFPNP